MGRGRDYWSQRFLSIGLELKISPNSWDLCPGTWNIQNSLKNKKFFRYFFVYVTNLFLEILHLTLKCDVMMFPTESGLIALRLVLRLKSTKSCKL